MTFFNQRDGWSGRRQCQKRSQNTMWSKAVGSGLAQSSPEADEAPGCQLTIWDAWKGACLGSRRLQFMFQFYCWLLLWPWSQENQPCTFQFIHQQSLWVTAMIRIQIRNNRTALTTTDILNQIHSVRATAVKQLIFDFGEAPCSSLLPCVPISLVMAFLLTPFIKTLHSNTATITEHSPTSSYLPTLTDPLDIDLPRRWTVNILVSPLHLPSSHSILTMAWDQEFEATLGNITRPCLL